MGVMHGDLRAPNILLVLRDGRYVAVLCDFGVSVSTNLSMQEQTTNQYTNFRYIAPEFAASPQERGPLLSNEADVYALGCVLYTLLTCRLPFSAYDGHERTKVYIDAKNNGLGIVQQTGDMGTWEHWQVLLQLTNPKPRERLTAAEAYEALLTLK